MIEQFVLHNRHGQTYRKNLSIVSKVFQFIICVLEC